MMFADGTILTWAIDLAFALLLVSMALAFLRLALPKGRATDSAAKTGSRLRYGPPAAVRVVSAFARFEAVTVIRARCASSPETAMSTTSESFTVPTSPRP